MDVLDNSVPVPDDEVQSPQLPVEAFTEQPPSEHPDHELVDPVNADCKLDSKGEFIKLDHVVAISVSKKLP